MPTARISVPVKQSTSVKSLPATSPKTPASITRTKARMGHRRRARGRLDDTDTDDDLVREPRSDESDTDSAPSTPDYDSASESEPEGGGKSNATMSSPTRLPLLTTASESLSPPQSPPKPPVFAQPHDWSDQVADEHANGAAALPVIDFADLSSHDPAVSPKSNKTLSPPYTATNQAGPSREFATSRPPPNATRKPGQSARQLYLTRLDNDPAYVPTVGKFWSHDDRLLDKDLRSLSGWWRGRWEERGRGGFGRGGRGRGGFSGSGAWGARGRRGRGGFANGVGPGRTEVSSEAVAPPVDRQWTHDGYDELNGDDEAKNPRVPFRGRAGFSRGRSGFRGSFAARGSFTAGNRTSPYGSPASARLRPESQHSHNSDTLQFGNGVRTWFPMKPERIWTKQFDGYLFMDTQLKPMHGQGLGQGVRVKLPGKRYAKEQSDGAIVIRLPLPTVTTSIPIASTSKEQLLDKSVVVKLPSTRTLQNLPEIAEIAAPEDVVTVTAPPMDDSLSPSVPPPAPPTQNTHVFNSSRPVFPPVRRSSDVVVSLSQASPSISAAVDEPFTRTQVHRITPDTSDFNEVSSPGPSMLHTPVDSHSTTDISQPQVPVLLPPQTVPPSFSSPYTYAAPGLPLPPGIAVSESGVTYEISTGRAVYLHTPPPPAPPPPIQMPMYNPRPMPMHHNHHGSVHFLPHPGHTSSMSMSVSPPAFMPSPPIFSLPRQNSRIEIRAPGEDKGKGQQFHQRTNSQARQTGSRLSVNVNAEPFTPATHLQSQTMGYYTADAQQQAFDDAQRQHQHQQSLYQQTTYYYPVGTDGNTAYGYGQQFPNFDPNQPQPYDMYGQESYPPHTGPVYY